MRTYSRRTAPADAAVAEIGGIGLEPGIEELADTIHALASDELGLAPGGRVRWWVRDLDHKLASWALCYVASPTLAEIEENDIRAFTDPTVLAAGDVWLRLEDDPYLVALVTAHEVRHRWQTERSGAAADGPDERAGREADAQAWSRAFVRRLGLFPALEPDARRRALALHAVDPTALVPATEEDGLHTVARILEYRARQGQKGSRP